jgi:hypothetical protein
MKAAPAAKASRGLSGHAARRSVSSNVLSFAVSFYKHLLHSNFAVRIGYRFAGSDGTGKFAFYRRPYFRAIVLTLKRLFALSAQRL